METIVIKARGKVNLTLDVLAKRSDGYHEVEMVMHPIDLYDVITMTRHPLKKECKTILTASVDYLPLDEGNIAYQAVEILRRTYGFQDNIEVHIDKHIPVAAGLAGGSSNAAAVLNGLNTLLELGASKETLMALGKELGADVPFCILGGAAIARGIGEKLTPIKAIDQFWIVLSKPSIGVSTKDVYGNLEVSQIESHPNATAMIDAMEKGDLRQIELQLGNVLEEVTLKRYPIVGTVKSRFKEYGARTPLMSGSGPTVFALFKEKHRAETVYENMIKRYAQTYMVKLYDGGNL